MFVYNTVRKTVEIIRPEEFSGVRHVAVQHWTKRQRLMVIDDFIRCDNTVTAYLATSSTNRVNIFKTALEKMVDGTLPFDPRVIYVLLKDVEWELKWRVR